MDHPFSPGANTVNINVGAASANVLVTNSDGEQQIRVLNNGTATAWIVFGADNTVAATLGASMPIGPGQWEVFTRNGPVWAAAIAAAATGKVYFTPGEGL